MAGKVKGFTLVELLIVIVIIATLGTFAAMNAISWIRESRVNQGRDMLVSDLEETKLKAMTGIPKAIFVLGGINTGYSIRQLTDDNENFVRDPGEANTTLGSVTLEKGVKISLDNGEELWFDRKGVPRTSAWGVPERTLAVWYDINGNNAHDSGEYQKQVILSAGGRIQYEK